MSNEEEPEKVQLDERSTEALVERIANRLKPKDVPKVEAPTPAPATVADKLSGLSDAEVADLADAVYERVEEKQQGKQPEPTTVEAALKQGMKENPRDTLSTFYQAIGEAKAKRDEAKREDIENE